MTPAVTDPRGVSGRPMWMPRMTIDQINILMMVGAAGAAYIAPFELVLVSYAFLGPAHYVTQISWMHDRGYCADAQWLWLPMGLLATLSLAMAVPADFAGSPGFYWLTAVMYVACVAGSAALALVRGWWRQLALCLGLSAGYAVFSLEWPAVSKGVAVMLPTVAHIYLFTLMFIVLGALKTGSRWGFASVVALLGCGAVFFMMPPGERVLYPVFADSNMVFFVGIVDFVSFEIAPTTQVSHTSIFGFLSFAYTYHYLNWFSKVRVIRWHTIPRRRLPWLAVVYVASVALYLVDYTLGFIALLFLSLLHVLLELPLNILTGRRIAAEIVGRVARARA